MTTSLPRAPRRSVGSDVLGALGWTLVLAGTVVLAVLVPELGAMLDGVRSRNATTPFFSPIGVAR